MRGSIVSIDLIKVDRLKPANFCSEINTLQLYHRFHFVNNWTSLGELLQKKFRQKGLQANVSVLTSLTCGRARDSTFRLGKLRRQDALNVTKRVREL